MVVVRMISPKTGLLSFGKVLVRLLNSSVLRAGPCTLPFLQ